MFGFFICCCWLLKAHHASRHSGCVPRYARCVRCDIAGLGGVAGRHLVLDLNGAVGWMVVHGLALSLRCRFSHYGGHGAGAWASAVRRERCSLLVDAQMMEACRSRIMSLIVLLTRRRRYRHPCQTIILAPQASRNACLRASNERRSENHLASRRVTRGGESEQAVAIEESPCRALAVVVRRRGRGTAFVRDVGFGLFSREW